MSKGQDLRTLDRLISDKRREFGWDEADERERRRAVYHNILEGYRSLEEVKEFIEGMGDDNVIYTARGNEISFSLLKIIIKHIEGNPWYSPWKGLEKPRALPQTDLEELKAKLAKYKSLTDFNDRLNFPPPPKMAMRCTQCGKIYHYWQPTWGDVEFELERGRNPLRELSGLCPKCAGPEEEEEENAVPMVSPLDNLKAKLLEHTEVRKGRCYELAWRHIAYQDEGTLVHGQIWSPNLGRMIDHAWVVTETGFVYEPVSDLYFRKDAMYRDYKMEEINTYGPTEARKMAIGTKSFGPWSAEDRRKFL